MTSTKVAHPYIVGISGGIGAGKSVIAHELSIRGYAVYDSDKEARRIINTDENIRQQLILLFGENVYLADGLNRKYVAEKIFADTTLLEAMNAIVHPAVRKDISKWIQRKENQPFVFIESAIMYESGFSDMCNKVIWVTAPEKLRICRVMKRDNTTESAVRMRISKQANELENIQRADIILNNDGMTSVKSLTNTLLAQLIS